MTDSEDDFQELLTELRATIAGADLKHAGKIVLAVGQAMLDKCNNYSPFGSLMMKLGTDDEKLTVCLAKDDAAPMLATAHEALKRHMGVGEP